MKHKSSSTDFNDGIWFCVQEIVVTYDQPHIAEQIIREAGLDKQTCTALQAASGSYDKEMSEFIKNLTL